MGHFGHTAYFIPALVEDKLTVLNGSSPGQTLLITRLLRGSNQTPPSFRLREISLKNFVGVQNINQIDTLFHWRQVKVS